MKKLTKSNIVFLLSLSLLIVLVSSCGESFLQPEPKSFLSSSNTLINRPGFEAVLLSARRLTADQYYGKGSLILSEYLLTDISSSGRYASNTINLPAQFTPTGTGRISVEAYWNRAYKVINYANVVISNIDNGNVKWKSDEERNTVLSEAYFYRSYWYYRLVNQFGDVPLSLEVVKKAKLDFNTFTREAVLKKIRDDMKFAIKYLPTKSEVQAGRENKATGEYLLTKIYMELRQFGDAITSASNIIDDAQYQLMENRFGSGPNASDTTYNVMWDLFQKPNIASSENTEAIFVTQDRKDVQGNFPGQTRFMVNAVPRWWQGVTVKDPDGKTATTAEVPIGDPLATILGRALSFVRVDPYYSYTIWQDDTTDYRRAGHNWFNKDQFYYNVPSSNYYNQTFEQGVQQGAEIDTLVGWWAFPYNKLYRPDETYPRPRGGHSDWYMYRLAGAYLLRAEAYFWDGKNGMAADDINKVRERAHAKDITAANVNIGTIFDERARELYFESPRKSELTRVAYIEAQLDRDGYNLKDMSQNNWYYDRVINHNVFYREHLSRNNVPFVMKPYNVYWPVPQNAIDANQFGHINQNEGYVGAENNVKPRDLSDIENKN